MNLNTFVCHVLSKYKRNYDKTNFIPRWISESSIPKKKCSMEHCQAELHTHTTLASVEQIKTILKARVNEFIVSSSSQSVGLCNEHYAQV